MADLCSNEIIDKLEKEQTQNTAWAWNAKQPQNLFHVGATVRQKEMSM